MSSSEDDRPLASRNRVNGKTKVNGRRSPVLPAKISAAVDRQVDRDFDKMDVDHHDNKAAVSIANGPVKEVVVDASFRSPNKRKIQKSPVKSRNLSDSDSDVPITKRRRTSNGIAKKEPESSDDDVPLARRKQAANGRNASPRTVIKKPPTTIIAKDESSDSDVPLAAAKLSKEKAKIQKKAETTAKKIRSDKKTPAPKKSAQKQESESDSDVPLKSKKRSNGVKKDSSDDDKRFAKKAKRAPVKTETKAKGRVKKEETPASAATPADAEEGEDDDGYKWWENQAETDGTQKWTTLEHNGVLFPPPYEPLPPNVKMKYDGADVYLSLEAEEVAGFYGAMLDTTHAASKTFQTNFFNDFKEIIKETKGAKNSSGKRIEIKEFKKCDFNPIFQYFEERKEEKKKLTAAEKKAIKVEKEELEQKYTYCYLDGRKEKVGNFRIEPPGLFRGRGDHPKTGKVKKRVLPEQVTINIGKDAEVPQPPTGHKWAAVSHDNSVTWLATWKENVNGNIKYVMLAATSSLKGMSDYKKFEKARELKTIIDQIRKDYNSDMKETSMQIRQRATAMYLIDQLALRAGNEKGEDEADTVGCCSLRFEHVTLEPPNFVLFDFLGKDSIRFQQKTTVSDQVFKNLRIFKKAPKCTGDMIFDRLSTTDLNRHLQSYMSGLSAKVFRTYNASWTMQEQLKKIPIEGTVHDKYAAYNLANKRVAELCNHQRSVSTTHAASMAKAEERIKALRYQKLRLKRQILWIEPARQKKKPAYFKPDPELLEEKNWIKDHQKFLIEQEREKITKKFEKDNEKLVADGEKELKPSELKTRLEVLKEMEEEFKEENKTGKVEPKNKSTTVEKVEAAIEKMEERIRKMETEKSVKDENKTVALGTSKINYIDPRLTVMFCKKYDVPIEKLFPKTLREKFKWALESADENWEF
ncbi:hypothetical protein EDC01DRAFT_26439 [Geopyxis carbonaria]|nr:hypothetical protein EDC01DRAFT_26439 [Geopyxis carbonaria]